MVKTLVHQLFTGPDADAYLNRLQREAQAAGRLNHPNIVGRGSRSEAAPMMLLERIQVGVTPPGVLPQ
jgi:hypothetical protein